VSLVATAFSGIGAFNEGIDAAGVILPFGIGLITKIGVGTDGTRATGAD
jgi:hypothetical protein